MNSEVYLNILHQHVLHLIRDMLAQGVPVVFQQDGSGPHKAHAVLRYLLSIPWLRTTSWPACSPDISPIEKIWAHMVQLVSHKHPVDQSGLQRAVKEAWVEATDPVHVANLISGVRSLLGKVVLAKGGNCFFESRKKSNRIY